MEQTTLGQKIKTLRETKHLTQEGLAQECGLTKDHISKIERNKRKSVRTDTLEKLAHALEVHPGELLNN